MAAPLFSCCKCGEVIPLSAGSRMGRRETCPKCSADLHCCHNCKFYYPHTHNECRETQAEYVQYKDEANLCDWFQPLLGEPRAGSGKAAGAADQARKKFDNLFKL